MASDSKWLRALPDKKVVYGVIDLADPVAETADVVAERLRGALQHIDAERLIAAPDCGMKYLPREVAFGKLRAMAEDPSADASDAAAPTQDDTIEYDDPDKTLEYSDDEYKEMIATFTTYAEDYEEAKEKTEEPYKAL